MSARETHTASSCGTLQFHDSHWHEDGWCSGVYPGGSPFLALDANYIIKQREFSEKTFGPGDRLQGVIDHIRKELIEVLEKPKDLAEWADVIILAIDGAWRSGASPQHIINAVHRKLDKNIARQWPDWRTQPVDKAIEHIRSAEPGEGMRVIHGEHNATPCWDCGVGPGELHLENCKQRLEVIRRTAGE